MHEKGSPDGCVWCTGAMHLFFCATFHELKGYSACAPCERVAALHEAKVIIAAFDSGHCGEE
jgi:hypothetical protein